MDTLKLRNLLKSGRILGHSKTNLKASEIYHLFQWCLQQRGCTVSYSCSKGVGNTDIILHCVLHLLISLAVPSDKVKFVITAITSTHLCSIDYHIPMSHDNMVSSSLQLQQTVHIRIFCHQLQPCLKGPKKAQGLTDTYDRVLTLRICLHGPSIKTQLEWRMSFDLEAGSTRRKLISQTVWLNWMPSQQYGWSHSEWTILFLQF